MTAKKSGLAAAMQKSVGASKKFHPDYQPPPSIQSLNPADFVAFQASAAPINQNLRFMLTQATDWTTELSNLSKALCADLTEWVNKTITSVNSLAQLQDELVHVAFSKGVEFENKCIAAKGDPQQLKRARDAYTRLWLDLNAKYTNSIVNGAQNLTYKRKHFSRLWLDSWDHLDKLATNLYNSFLDIDTELTHWADCDISPLRQLRTKLEAGGCDLPTCGEPFIPKEVVSLCPMDPAATKKMLASRPPLNLDSSDENNVDVMRRKIHALEQREQAIRKWLNEPFCTLSPNIEGNEDLYSAVRQFTASQLSSFPRGGLDNSSRTSSRSQRATRTHTPPSSTTTTSSISAVNSGSGGGGSGGGAHRGGRRGVSAENVDTPGDDDTCTSNSFGTSLEERSVTPDRRYGSSGRNRSGSRTRGMPSFAPPAQGDTAGGVGEDSFVDDTGQC